jgi:hypothetical protein
MNSFFKAVGWIAVLVWVGRMVAQHLDTPEVVQPIVVHQAAVSTSASDIPELPDSPNVGGSGPVQTEATADEDNRVMDDCFFMVSPEVKALIDKIKGCDIKHRIRKHDSSALAIIPAQGYKDGMAGVFKAFRLHINQNMEVACDDHHLYNADPQPGCMITVYVSRVRASGKYSDLAGWRASWFRGINEKSFHPASGFANYLSAGDVQMLNFGGFVDAEDRP